MLMMLQLVSTLASLYLPTVNAAIVDDGVARATPPPSYGWVR